MCGKKTYLFVGLFFSGISLCRASGFPAGLPITGRVMQEVTEQGGIQGHQSFRVTELEQVTREPRDVNQDKGMCCDPCGLCSCLGAAVKLCQEEYWRMGLQMFQDLYARHLVPRK